MRSPVWIRLYDSLVLATAINENDFGGLDFWDASGTCVQRVFKISTEKVLDLISESIIFSKDSILDLRDVELIE